MHVLNVNDSVCLKIGAGTAERTIQMNRSLVKHGVQSTVLTLNIGLDHLRLKALKPAKLVIVPCAWERFYVPKFCWSIIRHAVDEADFVHLMGHWSLLNALVYLAARVAKKPYAVCPAGSLKIYGRSGLLKILYNFLIGGSIIKNASVWIAITFDEFRDFELHGIPSSKITLIPNGVSADDFYARDPGKLSVINGAPNAPIILFMGRLNVIKGPDLLLKAFIASRDNFPEYHLVFAGPDEGMLAEMLFIAEHAGVSDFVHFLGFISGNEKTVAYHSASLLVVPSRQEAQSLVALEAGICGIPVLLTDACGFNAIRSVDSRLEVSATIQGLQEGLINLLSDSNSLKKIGPIWHEFVKNNYDWNVIVNLYIHAYRKILNKLKRDVK